MAIQDNLPRPGLTVATICIGAILFVVTAASPVRADPPVVIDPTHSAGSSVVTPGREDGLRIRRFIISTPPVQVTPPVVIDLTHKNGSAGNHGPSVTTGGLGGLHPQDGPPTSQPETRRPWRGQSPMNITGMLFADDSNSGNSAPDNQDQAPIVWPNQPAPNPAGPAVPLGPMAEQPPLPTADLTDAQRQLLELNPQLLEQLNKAYDRLVAQVNRFNAVRKNGETYAGEASVATAALGAARTNMKGVRSTVVGQLALLEKGLAAKAASPPPATTQPEEAIPSKPNALAVPGDSPLDLLRLPPEKPQAVANK